MSVNDGSVDALDGAAFELIAERVLRRRGLGEHDEAGRVAIDPMDDERLAFALRAQMRDELIDHRVRVLLPLERYGKQASWFVEDDERLVFEEDAQIAGANR